MDSVIEGGQLSEIYQKAIKPRIGELTRIREKAQKAVYYGVAAVVLLIIFIVLISNGASMAIAGLVLSVIGLIVVIVKGKRPGSFIIPDSKNRWYGRLLRW